MRMVVRLVSRHRLDTGVHLVERVSASHAPTVASVEPCHRHCEEKRGEGLRQRRSCGRPRVPAVGSPGADGPVVGQGPAGVVASPMNPCSRGPIRRRDRCPAHGAFGLGRRFSCAAELIHLDHCLVLWSLFDEATLSRGGSASDSLDLTRQPFDRVPVLPARHHSAASRRSSARPAEVVWALSRCREGREPGG